MCLNRIGKAQNCDRKGDFLDTALHVLRIKNSRTSELTESRIIHRYRE